MTGIPESNYESFQILQYQEGQFYRRHHDSSNANNNKPAGHRILTFFLYLNDVEEGGETRFSNLDISVAPKKVRLSSCCRACGTKRQYNNVFNNPLFLSTTGPSSDMAIRSERQPGCNGLKDVSRGKGCD